MARMARMFVRITVIGCRHRAAARGLRVCGFRVPHWCTCLLGGTPHSHAPVVTVLSVLCCVRAPSLWLHCAHTHTRSHDPRHFHSYTDVYKDGI